MNFRVLVHNVRYADHGSINNRSQLNLLTKSTQLRKQ